MHRSWLSLAAVILTGVVLSAPAQALEKSPAKESIRLNNLGVAYMNQQRFEQALELFQRVYRLDPRRKEARLNQGIALLNLQRSEAALEILVEITEQEPNNIRAWYNLGLLHKNMGQPETALEVFDHAAQLDPEDPDTHYFRGLLLTQLQRYQLALAAFQQALALNPFHVSAEFGMARAYQRLGDSASARQHLARFQKLTQEKLGTPMSLIYGEQGKYSLAEEIKPSPRPALTAVPVRFLPVTEKAGLDFFDDHAIPAGERESSKGALAAWLGPGVCFLDYNNDGHEDLFLLSGGRQSALYRNSGEGHFADAREEALPETPGEGLACTAGDYDNDGWTDLALSFVQGVKFYRNQGDGTFRDVTASTLQDRKPEDDPRRDSFPLGLTFLDYDHDGDLDLYIAYFPHVDRAQSGDPNIELGLLSAPNRLWRNNGNGTFTDQTKPTGLQGGKPSVTAIATDFNNDRALDLIVTGWQELPLVFSNPREGTFPLLQPWAEPVPPATAGALVFDFDKDGWMDLAFTHWNRPGLSLWRNVKGRRFERVSVPALDEWRRGWGLAVVDYDNDGWLDLAAVGETAEKTEARLLRNRGPEGFADVTAAVGLDAVSLQSPRSLLTADYDADGDTDLLVTQNGGPVVLLRNDGGNQNNWLRVTLKGQADNRSAIGTKVEVFAGTGWQKWEMQAASGYLGQSSLAITAGLGSAKEAEIVRLLWPTGVVQDEVQLAARATHAVGEMDRRGSSCPILFAWNGSRYEFISDVIGAAIVGHWVGPGKRNIPDPDEYVRVQGRQVEPRNGRLAFRFMEPMEELVFLDQVRLLAVDHPAASEVYPNEYFAAGPPFPAFKVIASRGARPPRGAWDDRGRDVRRRLLHRDRQYVTGFDLLSFKGLAELHTLELDLGEWNPAGPLRLILHGFIEYFTATSVYAAHQAGVVAVAPYVEALDASGRWTPVVDYMGFPAGLARTMVADLTGRLPAGARRIRIVTNLQIYWDQILIDTTPADVPVQLTEVPLAEAALAFRGYPRQVEREPAGDLTYVYEEVSPTGPYARHRGSYTRYGDVLPLVRDIDDRFAIFGTGEEVALEFDAATLPPLPARWRRDYFFFADGFVKDMDFYEAHGLTVGPVPFHQMGAYPYSAEKTYPEADRHLRYFLDYNTREMSGQEGAVFRFDYGREP